MKSIYFLLLLFGTIGAVYPSMFSNIIFSYSTKSDDIGNNNLFYFQYGWNDLISTRISYHRNAMMTQEDIPDFENSLLSRQSITTGLSLFPLVFNLFRTEEFSSFLGIGLDITSESQQERGNFNQSSNIQVYNNIYNSTSYIPLLLFNMKFFNNIIGVRYSFSGTPVYFFNFSQLISIKPLIQETGTNNFYSTGTIYLDHYFELSFFNIFGFRIYQNYQELDYNLFQVGIVNNSYAYASSRSQYANNSFDIMLFLMLKIESLNVRLGIGKQFSSVNDKIGKMSVSTEQWRTDIGIDFN